MAFASKEQREARISGEPSGGDPRSPFQRDRDRLLFSRELHRLAEITQVISPEGHTFHNRLTHTLEVAQIGQRMSQRLLLDHPELEEEELLNPDVVEAACLAHDLGHPPFGHVAEQALDELGKEHKGGGFEGNAQSFRIVTRLGIHSNANDGRGFDLTAATLNAVLKYPWKRKKNDKGHSKFGAYESDDESFQFARALMPGLQRERSLEAQVMDHADAIAYAVHDMIDFYQAGLLPLEDVFRAGAVDVFITKLEENGRAEKLLDGTGLKVLDVRRIANGLATSAVNIQQAYSGTRDEQFQMKELASRLINRYITAPEVVVKKGHSYPLLEIPPAHLVEINFLKELIWHYIINRPQLGTQQEGMRYIIQGLFEVYRRTIKDSGDKRLIPAMFHPDFDDLKGRKGKTVQPRQTRLAIDIVASLSDKQAMTLYGRLRGMNLGKVTDFIAS